MSERSQVKSKSQEFEELGRERQASLFEEFFTFIIENKAWWLIPIVAVFSIVGGLLLLTSTGAAPFIYALF